ncbi:RteC domain-containing protein [Filimonas effusa]|uniref:Tetracycline regulation of excision, RteC n=1 Tax=Filimonas effusa TaxID=2508721 RepID=A0A4Q1D1L5_9BACT|nr:RteC domain-containing protein [Filimonas effusa]RXK81674.1 hypothetical protein ESB13_17920 [Filimonas effusa]
MKKFIEKLISQLDEDLANVDETNEISQTRTSMDIVSRQLHELKNYILDYQFLNKEEEIDFFKTYLPPLYSKLLYYKQVLHWEVRSPFASQAQRAYLEAELKRFTDALELEREFIAYCRTGNTTMDEIYFTRNEAFATHYEPDLAITYDIRFCTKGSLRLSHVLANEMLIRNIENRLQVNNVSAEKAGKSSHQADDLVFTGSKNDLTELIFALHSSGVFGQATVRQIADWIQASLHVSLNNYYRVFQSLRIRKDPVQFLHFLTNALTKRMDEADLNPRY